MSRQTGGDGNPHVRDFGVCRTEDTNLVFRGREVLNTDNQYASKHGDRMRYNSIHVMQTVGGTLVLRIGFHSQFDDEPAHYTAWTTKDPTEVARRIKAYDAATGVMGCPNVDIERLRRNYAHLASDALGLLFVCEELA